MYKKSQSRNEARSILIHFNHSNASITASSGKLTGTSTPCLGLFIDGKTVHFRNAAWKSDGGPENDTWHVGIEGRSCSDVDNMLYSCAKKRDDTNSAVFELAWPPTNLEKS